MQKYKKNFTYSEDLLSPVPILNNRKTNYTTSSYKNYFNNNNSNSNNNSNNNNNNNKFNDALCGNSISNNSLNNIFIDDNCSICSDITSCDTDIATSNLVHIHIKNVTFHYVINMMRTFFLKNGFIECYFENSIGIINKCNEPFSIRYYYQNDQKYLLTQTNNLSLENELLNNKNQKGFFTLSNCYINSSNENYNNSIHVIPKIEFCIKGGMYELEKMERDMLTYLGFKKIHGNNYATISKKYDVNLYNYKKINEIEGEVFFIKNFPKNVTNKHWNVEYNKEIDTMKEIMVLINGLIVIDSIENSTNKKNMLENFYNLSNGEYSNRFNEIFDKTIITDELNKYLSNDFIIRSSGEINIYNLIESMVHHKHIPRKYL